MGEVLCRNPLMQVACRSKTHRTPHSLIPLPTNRFQEDLRYDVQVEMELVRPARGSVEMGESPVAQLSDARRQLYALPRATFAAQRGLGDHHRRPAGESPTRSELIRDQSLPPPALPASILVFPTIPLSYLPPCIIPWPFRSFCPSRLLGYGHRTDSKIKERKTKGMFASPAKGKDVVLLTKELMEGVVLTPSRGGEASIGSVFVSIGECRVTDVADRYV